MTWCGDGRCAARIQIWLITPDDGGISDPCPQCLHALAGTLGLDPRPAPRSLIELHAEVGPAGAL